jgi:phosphoribosylformylglycinamidine synthase subunit PurQ / glutaminase
MVKVIVLRAAGTNCAQETQEAFRRYSEKVDLVHVNELKSGRKSLASYHILTIPGGFTYGDDIAAGKILANELKFTLKDKLIKFIEDGKLILGICNGFQVLVKAGLLPDFTDLAQKATLLPNDSGKFEDRWVYLKKPEILRQAQDTSPKDTEQSRSARNQKTDKCVWTRGIDKIIYLPVAHAEGKFQAEENVLDELRKNNQIVFQYVDREGNLAGYPCNPSGSALNIAGICDKTGRILALMPHPERFSDVHHHPHWQRLEKAEEAEGNLIFKNAVDYARKNLIKN